MVPVGRGVEGFDVSPDGKEIWAANAQDGTVSIVDVVTKTVTQTLAANVNGANRLKFTPDGKLVFVSTLSGPDVVIINAGTRREVKRLKVGRGAAGIQMQPDGARGYVACTPDNSVAVIDLKSLEVTGRIDAGGQPTASPGCRRLALAVLASCAWSVSRCGRARRRPTRPRRCPAAGSIRAQAVRRRVLVPAVANARMRRLPKAPAPTRVPEWWRYCSRSAASMLVQALGRRVAWADLDGVGYGREYFHTLAISRCRSDAARADRSPPVARDVRARRSDWIDGTASVRDAGAGISSTSTSR